LRHHNILSVVSATLHKLQSWNFMWTPCF